MGGKDEMDEKLPGKFKNLKLRENYELPLNVYNLMCFHDVTNLLHEVCFTHEGDTNSAMLHITMFFEECYWAIKKP